jgi:hypothetical protein
LYGFTVPADRDAKKLVASMGGSATRVPHEASACNTFHLIQLLVLRCCAI